MYVLDVGIPFTQEMDAFEVATKIEDLLGYADSAGSGFGFRDMQFEFDSWTDAFLAEQDVREYLAIRNIKVQFDFEVGIDDTAAYCDFYQERLLP